MSELAFVARTYSELDCLDPWKDDGNVVLAAEGKYFRVHRSILIAHSGVFRDMFNTCSHSNEPDEFIEECPAIYLHDAAIDIQTVPKALYDRRSVDNDVSHCPPRR